MAAALLGRPAAAVAPSAGRALAGRPALWPCQCQPPSWRAARNGLSQWLWAGCCATDASSWGFTWCSCTCWYMCWPRCSPAADIPQQQQQPTERPPGGLLMSSGVSCAACIVIVLPNMLEDGNLAFSTGYHTCHCCCCQVIDSAAALPAC